MRRAWRLFAIAAITLMVRVTLCPASLADPRTVKLSADAEEIYSVEFFIDPQNQTSSTVEDAPGQNIVLTQFTSEWLLHNRLVFYIRLENISENRNFHQRFFFKLTEDAHGKNVVSAEIPQVTDADLGGDGVLSPGEETSQLKFEVRHKDKPFSFFVHAHAVVKAVEISEILAEKIAFAGHGKVFDKHMNEIELDTSLITEMQDSILEESLKTSELASDPGVQQALKTLKLHRLTTDETIVIKSAINSKLLQQAPEQLITKFDWRNSVLLSQYFTLHPNPELIESLRPQTLDLLNRLDFFKPVPETNYIANCRAHLVPIPPTWAESGTDWVKQGALTQNLAITPPQTSLDVPPIPSGQEKSATVYTYSDPSVRGACIALPRDTGAAGSVAGIICQSAATGHACFWDNKLRTDPSQQPIGWRGQQLAVSKLRNGSDLAQNCTGCHRGNNVFLISPDDPTWAKVLRGTTDNFTTQVEASSDIQSDHFRYIPIPNEPERPGWKNTFSPSNCSGQCHEAPVVAMPVPMPPRCQLTATDPSMLCYRPSICPTGVPRVLAGSCDPVGGVFASIIRSILAANSLILEAISGL